MCRPTPSNATGDWRSSGCFVSSKEKGGDRPRAPAACRRPVRRRARPRCARAGRVRGGGMRTTTKRCDRRWRRCWRTRRRRRGFSRRRSAKWRRTSWLMSTGRRSWAGRSVRTRFCLSSARAGWARCIAPAIRSWAATSPSRSWPTPSLSDPERLARFEREARVLATLNHPHIGAIYGLEEADGVRGLVLELVEGATLAERLALGSVADSGGAHGRAPDRGGARSGAREGHHPPRSETGQHQDHA